MYDPTATWHSPELRLVRRITMGLTLEEAKTALRMGYNGYLEQQLNYQTIDDSALENSIAATYPSLTRPAAQLLTDEHDNSEADVCMATITRSAFSKRQLYQRMVEFWTDHFNILMFKVDQSKVVDDREVIRKNAMTKFPALLSASAHSPAMLEFLDNVASEPDHPNQNYARELMELHTLGVDGGYTQQDVEEVARCFTGWTRIYDTTRPDYGAFNFNTDLHDNGSKTLFRGTPYETAIPANGGQRDGEIVLRVLGAHPSTASHIAGKLTRWLLRYDPSPQLVQNVARVYLATGGDIRSTIRTILTQSNLMSAPAKFKRPYHLFLSALRAANAKIDNPMSVFTQLYSLGQQLFSWPAPNGYQDDPTVWSSLLLPRWNAAFSLLNNELDGVTVSVSPLVKLGSSEAVTERLDVLLFGGEMNPNEKRLLESFLHGRRATDKTVRDAMALALASPGFQWY